MTNELLKKIKNSLRNSIEQCENPVAAFDADGTLWSSDIGRDFFQYQIEKGLLKKKIDQPRSEFEHIKFYEGKAQALTWLAYVLSGFLLEEVQGWIKEFLKDRQPTPFLFQKKLISWLQEMNVQVFIVSSSLKWLLDPAVNMFNIPSENIIGVQTVVKKGIITDELIMPAPIQEDKVPALYEKTNNKPPLFSAGNTLSDKALLEAATQTQLVVSTAKEKDFNYLSEKKLLQIAKTKKWFYSFGEDI